jgi:segregation and condensation protein B
VHFRTGNPAQQLRSVAVRYCHALAARNCPPHALARPGGEPLAEVSSIAAQPASESERQAADIARLEAILLLAREPLTSRRLSQYANLADGTRARTLVRRLNEHYDRAGRAFRVEEVAGGFQLLSRRKFASWLRRLGHVPPETRLSAPALETLAVVAYRQPVPRADIEAIRGVNCGEIVRQLMERDLVRIGGRSEELGRPFLYSTTKRFLQIFGLVSLEDLPRASAMRSSTKTIAAPAIPEMLASETSPSPSGEADEVEYITE